VPALVGPIVGFALGVALAWACRREAWREEDAALRLRLAIAALFACLVYAPACAYFVIFAGDWALFYLVDSRSVPSALLLLLVASDAAAVVAGFWAAYQAARRRWEQPLVALGVGPTLAALAGLFVFLRPLRIDGTYQQVSAGFGTRSVVGGPLGYAVLWMSAMIVVGAVVAARALTERPRTTSDPRDGPPRPASAPKPLAMPRRKSS
jgi:hypothetical protein